MSTSPEVAQLLQQNPALLLQLLQLQQQQQQQQQETTAKDPLAALLAQHSAPSMLAASLPTPSVVPLPSIPNLPGALPNLPTGLSAGGGGTGAAGLAELVKLQELLLLQQAAGLPVSGLPGGLPTGLPSLGGGKKDDWMCIGCGTMNYPSRKWCKKCDMAKLGETEPKRTGKSPPRGGDWMCTKCSNINWESRDKWCHRCNQPKDPLAPTVAQLQASGLNLEQLRRRTGKSPPRDGDWICPQCENHNWETRMWCKRCQTEKPGMEGMTRRPSMPGGGRPAGGGQGGGAPISAEASDVLAAIKAATGGTQSSSSSSDSSQAQRFSPYDASTTPKVVILDTDGDVTVLTAEGGKMFLSIKRVSSSQVERLDPVKSCRLDPANRWMSLECGGSNPRFPTWSLRFVSEGSEFDKQAQEVETLCSIANVPFKLDEMQPSNMQSSAM